MSLPTSVFPLKVVLAGEFLSLSLSLALALSLPGMARTVTPALSLFLSSMPPLTESCKYESLNLLKYWHFPFNELYSLISVASNVTPKHLGIERMTLHVSVFSQKLPLIRTKRKYQKLLGEITSWKNNRVCHFH